MIDAANAKLVLIRHGQSEWNACNLFTGLRDPDLTDRGVAEAQAAGQYLAASGFYPDIVFTSTLQRARRTATLILAEYARNETVPITASAALNERDYGALTGLNKNDARQQWGKQQVHIWRRSYDQPPPDGESLKQTAMRVIAYYEAHIQPCLVAGNAVLIAAHGNSMRALMMYLEAIPSEHMATLELATGVPVIYRRAPISPSSDGAPFALIREPAPAIAN